MVFTREGEMFMVRDNRRFPALVSEAALDPFIRRQPHHCD